MAITTLVLTALVTGGILFLVQRLFPKWGLLDRPEKYGHKRAAVAYPAGIIIPMIFFAVAFAITPESSGLYNPLIGFALASGLVAFVSFFDDRFGISPYFRLVIQLITALIIIGFGIGISEIRLPIGGISSLELGSLELFGKHFVLLADGLAVIWIIAMMNSMNWLDGVSGLTSSVSSIAATVLAFTAYTFGQSDVALLFGILAVICAVFFLFDLDQPKVLMGDSGSMFLGLALAVFTIIAGGKVATAMLVMFAPLFDAVWTIARRILSGRSPFKGDLEHLHHKLLEKIGSRRKLVIIYAAVTAIFGCSAYLLETEGKAVLLFILLILLTKIELWVHKK